MTEVNVRELRIELIESLEAFLKDPPNRKIQEEARQLFLKYGGLLKDIKLFTDNIPENIFRGIGAIGEVFLYGVDISPPDEEIIKIAKEALEKLKKEGEPSEEPAEEEEKEEAWR